MAPVTTPRAPNPVFGLLFAFIMIGALLFWGGVLAYSEYQVHAALKVLGQLKKAETYIQRGSVSKARALYDEEIAKRPSVPEMYELVGESCHQAGQWNLEIEYANQGLARCKSASPEQVAMLYRVLSQASTEAQPAHPQTTAIQYAETALKLAPKDPANMNMLGYILADNDLQLDRAASLLTAALKSVKEDTDTPEGLSRAGGIEDSYGWVLYKLHKYPEAVQSLVQAVGDSSAPPDPGDLASALTSDPGEIFKVIYYHLGAAERKAGHNKEALIALTTALRYDPNYAPAKLEKAALDHNEPAPRSNSTPVHSSITSGANPMFTPLPKSSISQPPEIQMSQKLK